jgi:hypothetical protein
MEYVIPIAAIILVALVWYWEDAMIAVRSAQRLINWTRKKIGQPPGGHNAE